MRLSLLVILPALLATACGDALTGSWHLETNPAVDLEVRDGDEYWDLLGEGHVLGCIDGEPGECTLCHVFYQIEISERGSDEYTFHGNPDGEACGGGRFREFPCGLRGDSRLRCALADGKLEFVRDSD